MIDRMLGGQGRGAAPTRALTEIEQNVIDAVVKLICDNLTDTRHQIVDVPFKVNGRETRPQMLQVSAPNEVVVLLGFDVRLGEARGMLNLCIPASVIESVSESFSQTAHRIRREPTESDRRHPAGQPLAREAEGVGQSRHRFRQGIARLATGDVVSLGHLVRQPLESRVQDSPKFSGRLMVHRWVTAVRDRAGRAADSSARRRCPAPPMTH